MGDNNELDQLIRAALQASQSDDSARALQLLGQASERAPAWGLPHFLAGSEYAALGQMEAAEAAFANAVLLAPDLSIARYQLGLLQFSSGRAAVALLTWEPLLALPDTAPLPHFVRGFAALAQDDFGPASAHYRKGLTLNHDNPALASDIEKILQGIADVQRRTEQASEPVTVTESDAEEEAAATATHVLLSGYRQTH